MALSNDLVSQFAKITKDEKSKTEETVYGTTVEYNGEIYVKLDGSDQLTPVSTTTDMKAGERVTVTIKNHNATVTGNVSSPAARTEDVRELGTKISDFEIVIADKVSTTEFDAEKARIDKLVADDATIKGELDAAKADISELQADNVTIKGELDANEANITKLQAEKIDVNIADAKYATVENLEATNADLHSLEATYGDFATLTTNKLTAVDTDIKNLNTKYANIDFSNISKATMENFYANSGLIKNVEIGDAVITGELVGVTIKGDLIEGGTVVADKLVIKGNDGLYYKLNTDGVTTEAEQTEYNSLSGSVITAKSITATKIAVDDLVAFDATIGGFNITESAIYSGVKSSADNATRGVYMDKDGQWVVGDANNFIKYYRDTDGSYKLAISAKSIKLTASSTTSSGTDLETVVADSIVSSVEEFYQSTSPITLTGGSWSTEQLVWEDGKYIWRRTAVTHGDGSIEYTPNQNGVCITGNTGSKGDRGEKGEDSTVLKLESSRGNVFKNDTTATVISVVIYHGAQRITDSTAMKATFGDSAYLQWKCQLLNEDDFTDVPSTDDRLNNDGFMFTMLPSDVNNKITFMCELITT